MKKVLYLLLWMAWPVMAHAQDSDYMRYAATQKKFTFAVQPMQFFNNALRFDFEMRIGNGPGWLQFGPALYYSSDNGDVRDYYIGKERVYEGGFYFREPFSEMTGGGLDINYKYFLNSRRSLYVAGGLSYTHFTFQYWGRTWYDYVQDGLLYHELAEGRYGQYINRAGINWFFGYQPAVRHAFLFDVFWGVAYREAFRDKSKPPFNGSMFSYGYSGFVFMAGIRIGIGIK